jgi:NhaP-type Na+/H+ or K+/H+ antiporter
MARFITLTLLLGSMLMGQTIQDFTRIYDTYIAGVKSGEFRKISTLLSQELRSGIKTKEDQQEFMRVGNGVRLDT